MRHVPVRNGKRTLRIRTCNTCIRLDIDDHTTWKSIKQSLLRDSGEADWTKVTLWTDPHRSQSVDPSSGDGLVGHDIHHGILLYAFDVCGFMYIMYSLLGFRLRSHLSKDTKLI